MLLDQRVVAGLGNIYADEALWRARLNPLRPANGLDDEEVRRLTRAIRAALRTGIDRQGSTLRDYAAPDGAVGVDAGRVPRLRSRRRAVPALPSDDREDARRRPGNVVLPPLPAAPGMTWRR